MIHPHIREEDAVIGIIGGSGLYEMSALGNVDSIRVETPFGDPSDELITGVLEGRRMVFLPRHGKGHCLSPSEINHRANLYAMKTLGVTRIISVSAVGSMREEILPGDIVVCDQFVDCTRGRASTFFRDGIVAHVLFADPVCPNLNRWLYEAGVEAGARIHNGGTYLVIEGPQFSTRAESKIYRQWGADVIGMTNLPEAKLAREAEICYGVLALATDYDCWHETEEDVSVDAVLDVLRNNATMAQAIVQAAVRKIGRKRECACADALQGAVITDRSKVPGSIKKKLDLLIGRYL
jgi:5'-methylthioadenosine phosphorylase